MENSSSPSSERCSSFFAAMSVRTTLVLPLSIFILYLGLQRWRHQRCFDSESLSDVFTYNLAAVELLWFFGFLCRVSVEYFNLPVVMAVGKWASLMTFYGELLFHVLTCAERYIAVVRPVTYLRLKRTCGLRIRDVSVGCAWLLCLVLIVLDVVLTETRRSVPLFCLLAFSITVTSFCSLFVLCVLIRPGPGEGRGQKKQVDRSRLRAFHTIAAVSGAQWVWFSGLLVSTALSGTSELSGQDQCIVTATTGLCNLPSNLVLPLLYLHRAGKLASCCQSE